MFTQINGSGDYLGAAIVMDTTIAGALGFAEHLSPFILPIGIKGSYLQEVPPTEAKLICDFTNGFTLKGQADVKDGLVVFDNDILTDMKANGIDQGACHVQMIKGSEDAARLAALNQLADSLIQANMSRAALSHQEKTAYINGVFTDVQNNRRPSNDRYGSLWTAFSQMGWTGLAIEGLSRASEFYWHTNKQDVENLSKLKFEKKISINGHTTAERDLPTQLCLVFNPDLKAYDRCTEAELKEALTMAKAMSQAENSPECKDTKGPFECGRKRDESGTLPRGERTPLVNDAHLEPEIGLTSTGSP